MSMPRLLSRLVAVAAFAGCASMATAADPNSNHEAAVRRAMRAQFDKPEARLQVDPVAVSGDAAVASWAQGERGGRALLFQKGGKWQIALCAGDALRDAQVMREAGVAPRDADAIVESLARKEAQLTPEQRARFASFDGMVHMGAGGQHPAARKH